MHACGKVVSTSWALFTVSNLSLLSPTESLYAIDWKIIARDRPLFFYIFDGCVIASIIILLQARELNHDRLLNARSGAIGERYANASVYNLGRAQIPFPTSSKRKSYDGRLAMSGRFGKKMLYFLCTSCC